MNTPQSASRPRVLVVAYYMPPSGGPGVQRVLKAVKYLTELGWTPEVLTVQAGAYPEHDPSLADDVPEGVRVHRTASLDPYHVYARFAGRDARDAVTVGSVAGQTGWKDRLAQWIRANVFLPDARVGWVPFAIARGRRVLRERPFDAILTSGPPHSVHLTGAALQALTGVPWVADFRDPWTDINYYHELPHTRWARRLDSALERMVLRRAVAVTTVSPTWADLLAHKAEAQTPVHVVHNGYDADDFADGDGAVSGEHFDLTYVGSLYASRNPSVVWRVLADLRSAGRLPKLRLRLVGSVDPTVETALREHGLRDITTVTGYVPHAEAVAEMQQAALLLLVIEAFDADGGMITGKLYEYLASQRPVLGVGPPGGDAAALLQSTGGGMMVGRADAESLRDALLAHYDAWASGAPTSGAAPSAVAPYRRRAQTERLARVLQRAKTGGGHE